MSIGYQRLVPITLPGAKDRDFIFEKGLIPLYLVFLAHIIPSWAHESLPIEEFKIGFAESTKMFSHTMHELVFTTYEKIFIIKEYRFCRPL